MTAFSTCHLSERSCCLVQRMIGQPSHQAVSVALEIHMRLQTLFFTGRIAARRGPIVSCRCDSAGRLLEVENRKELAFPASGRFHKS